MKRLIARYNEIEQGIEDYFAELNDESKMEEMQLFYDTCRREYRDAWYTIFQGYNTLETEPDYEYVWDLSWEEKMELAKELDENMD